MKATLSWDEFLNAYYELATAEQPDPGIQRLYKHLGKGSVYLITKYKARLGELRKQALPLSTGKVPDPISALAGRLWQEIEQALQEKERDLEAQCRPQKAALQQTIDTLREQLGQSEETLQALKKAHQQLQSAHDTLNEKLADSQRQQHDTALQLQAKTELCASIEDNLRRLETHYQQALEHEREQGRQIQQRLTKERDALQTQCDELRKALEHEQLRAIEQKNASDDALQKMNVYYDGEIKQRDAALADREAALSALQQEKAELQKQVNQSNEAAQHSEAQYHQAQTQCADLQRELDAAQARIAQLEKDREGLLAAVIAKEDV